MVSQELAKMNPRSMGTECGVRLPDRLVSKIAPDALHAHAKIFRNRKQNLSQEVDEMMIKSVIEVAEPVKNQFVGHFFLRQKKSGKFRPT